MAIDNEAICLKCGRDQDRCVCEIEFVHGSAYGEHRASRMPEGVEPIDPMSARAINEVVPAEALREKRGLR